MVATAALVLFNAFLQAGHWDGEVASPALLPVAWLARGGRAGKAHCRPCRDGGGCCTLLYAALRCPWWWLLTTPEKNCVCTVLIFFLNRSTQRCYQPSLDQHFHLQSHQRLAVLDMVDASSSFSKKLLSVALPCCQKTSPCEINILCNGVFMNTDLGAFSTAMDLRGCSSWKCCINMLLTH